MSNRTEVGTPHNTSRAGGILPLTGVWIIAALRMVIFHIRGNLHVEFPVLGRIVSLIQFTLIEPIWWAQNVWPDVLAPQTVLTKLVFLSVPVVACIAAYARWRWVEEPARKTMRAMTKPRHGLRLNWATVPTTPAWTSRGWHTNPA